MSRTLEWIFRSLQLGRACLRFHGVMGVLSEVCRQEMDEIAAAMKELLYEGKEIKVNGKTVLVEKGSLV